MQELRIPDQEFKERIEKIKARLDEKGLDAILLLGDEHRYGHVRYVSDYRPILEYAVAIVPLEGEPILLAGPECGDYAYMTSKIEDIRICCDLAIPGEEYPTIKMVSLADVIKELDSKKRLNRLGVADLDLQPAFLVDTIRRTLAGRELIDATQIMNELRAIKSPNEIAIMRKVFEIGSIGLKVGIEKAKVGMGETDLAAEMACAMWREGAEQMSHCFMVASGKRTGPALSFPTDKKAIEDGDLVILDIGAVYEGYFSDNARTIIVGKETKERAHALKVAEEAKNAAIAKIRAGAQASEVDRAAREIVEEAGFGKNCIYGVLHGVGLQHCEYPYAGPKSDLILQEGMVFCVDVGLFNLPFGGIRMEDGLVVTRDGAEVLTKVGA
ncbi:MAG: aminopeptidase P family protein [Candidatus Latescibacteria bacterium]|nr:aminopeptidase P family protein [Candidatus Latescibacterota bacterium]